jgi:hypothetical protein
MKHKQKLLTFGNPKVLKGIKKGIVTAILHFAPHKLSGRNVCPHASRGCSKTCLHTAGVPFHQSSKDKARIKRTNFYFENRKAFMEQLAHEIKLFMKRAERSNFIPAFRPNGTSDIASLGLEVARMFPTLQVYDYTKNLATLLRSDLPSNYHLTFSRSETNGMQCLTALKMGFNVAVVFKGRLPETFWGYKVINGDETDLRFLDERGVIVGLLAKGEAKKDDTGFALDEDEVALINNRILRFDKAKANLIDA